MNQKNNRLYRNVCGAVGFVQNKADFVVSILRNGYLQCVSLYFLMPRAIFGYRGCLRCRAALYRTASCAGYTDCAGISCLLPAGAGRQLPLYNYDSGCFIFDTMAESRINTLPKPDVIFFQDIISLKNNCYCNYQTGRVRFYCAGLVYLYF